MVDATNGRIDEMVGFLKVSLGQITGVGWFSVIINEASTLKELVGMMIWSSR